MREIRPSGSEGGGPEPNTGPPTPIWVGHHLLIPVDAILISRDIVAGVTALSVGLEQRSELRPRARKSEHLKEIGINTPHLVALNHRRDHPALKL
jgi:hypothetical protein